MARKTKILTLAITAQEDSLGCVAALSDEGNWIRPQPVLTSDLRAADSPFRYGAWTTVHLDHGNPSGRREDRTILSPPQLDRILKREEWKKHFVEAVDTGVDEGFSVERSVALICVKVEGVYMRRHIRNRHFLRLQFRDETGEQYDWIVPEIRLGETVAPYVQDGILDPGFAKDLVAALQTEVYLTIGLTLPNDRMPGRYRNCHPLVVGVHSFPDYFRGLRDEA